MQTPNVFVRRATAADSEVIAAHRQMAISESLRYRGERIDQSQKGSEISLVAGVGETPLGSLVAESADKTEWTITHVFVDPEAREIGLGDTLMQHLVDELRSIGAKRLSSQAQPGDRALKNLFERHGLVAQTILVGRRLD